MRELCEPAAGVPLLLPRANGSSKHPPNGLLRHEHEHEHEHQHELEHEHSKEKENGRVSGTGQRSASAWVLKSDEALSEWLQALWVRKEALLYATYSALGLRRAHEMPPEWSARAEVREPWWVRPLYVFCLAYWSCFLFLAAYLVLHSRAFDLYLLASSVGYVLVTVMFGGTDKLQIYRCNPRFTTAEVPERVLAQLPADADEDADAVEDDADSDDKLLSKENQKGKECDCNHKVAPMPMTMPSPPPELQKGLNASLEDTERALRLRELHVAQQ